MEPLSYFTASAIWSGIATIAGTLAGEVAGGRADAGVVLSYEKIRANLSQYHPDGNHDIERAIYRAYLQASMQTLIYHYGERGYDAPGLVRLLEVLPTWTAKVAVRWRARPYLGKTSDAERQWIETALPRLREALALSDQSAFVDNLNAHPELSQLREKYALLLRPPAGEARVPDLRTSLVDSVLVDLEQRTPAVPEGLAVVIRTHWFDLFCGCFQSIFKDDDKVQAIVLGKLLAGVAVRQEDGAQTAFDVDTVSQRLLAVIEPVLRTVLEEFATRIEDKIDERADRLEANDIQIQAEIAAVKWNTGEILKLARKLATEGLLSPPVQLAPSSSGNLPQRRRTFVGRQDWLTIIEQRLRTDETITITSLRGVPGVGKSALALECAHRFADLFPDGCFWLDLRGNDVASALRGMLIESGLAQSTELEGGFDVVCAVWRQRSNGKKLLLVVDNAEKLVASQPEFLSRLYPPAPVRTLITSRVAIDPSRDLRIDILSELDALALLKARGVDVDGQRTDAARLAQRLGYLALALDITARRMALYTPALTCARVLADLERAKSVMALLRLPRKDNVDDNAAESFALSYTMLDEPLRAAFHALGICAPSGTSLTGLAAVLKMDETEAGELALALSALSLAECDGTRVELHPLLHEYASARLRDTPAREQQLIAAYVAHFGLTIGGACQSAVNEDRGADAEAALQVIDREYANVRLAQVRALEDGFPDPQLAVELTDNLMPVWRLRDETRLWDWLTRALSLAQAAGLTHRQANVLRAIGDVQSFRDDKDAALESYAQALTRFTQVGDKVGQATALRAIGDVQSFRDDKDAALESYAQALTRFTQVGTKLGQATVLKAIGDVQSFRDDKDAALESYAQALTRFTQVGDKLGQATVLQAIGEVQSFRDDKDAALESYAQALTRFTQMGNKLGQANVLKAIGDVQSFRDDKGAALESYAQALTLYTQVGAKLGQANVYLAQGQLQNDVSLLERALSLYEEIRDGYSIACCKYSLGVMYLQNGDGERGVRLLWEARETWEQINFAQGVQAIDTILREYGDDAENTADE